MAVTIEIPASEIETEAEIPSRTYGLDLDAGRIYGTVDGIAAVKQAVIKALLTVRYENLIYNDDYGCEAGNAVHDKNVTPEYLETAVPEMIKDALSQDTRILDVRDFEMEFKNDSVFVSFTVSTVFGETEISEYL